MVSPRKLLVFCALLCACPRDEDAPSDGKRPSDATGSLKVQRDKETVQLDIDNCWSGQMLSFYGVDLFHDPDIAKRLRVVDDPVEGMRIVLLGIVPTRDRVVVDHKSCSTFEVRLEPTNNYLNDIRSLKGSLKLECTLPDEAGKLSATVELNDCSFDNRARN